MKLLLATLSAILLFVPDNALPQISCFGYAGGMTSCNGPRSNTLITPLSPSQGLASPRGVRSRLEATGPFPADRLSRLIGWMDSTTWIASTIGPAAIVVRWAIRCCRCCWRSDESHTDCRSREVENRGPAHTRRRGDRLHEARRLPPSRSILWQRRVRISLGIAMGCVKREDTVLLPLEPIDTLIPLATEE